MSNIPANALAGGDGVVPAAALTSLTAPPSFVPRTLVPFASRGILFGACPFAFTPLAVVSAVDAVAAVRRAAATPAAERVTRVGRCSDAVPRTPTGRALWGFDFRRTGAGATPRAGRTSSSSASESVATRFVIGVLRGWAGGAISRACAWARATCLLGVSGGTGTAAVDAA